MAPDAPVCLEPRQLRFPANRLKRKGLDLSGRQDIEGPADSLQFFGPVGDVRHPSVIPRYSVANGLRGLRYCGLAILWMSWLLRVDHFDDDGE
jgi:hypothetical protein